MYVCTMYVCMYVQCMYVCMYVCMNAFMYLFAINLKSLKFTILFYKKPELKKKQSSVKPMDRKISRSLMAGINLIKIRQVLISARVPLGTLPIKGKISNNNKKKNR